MRRMRKHNRRSAVTAYVALVGGLDEGPRRDLGGLRRRVSFGRRARRSGPRLVADEHGEPTWELRPPTGKRPGTRRIDGRTRTILTVAAVAAIVVNACAAWAYWTVTRSEPAPARTGTAVQLTLSGRSDPSRPLTPGAVGSLTVTVNNDNDYPILITTVAPGVGKIIADRTHRDAGCLRGGVAMTKDQFAVSWSVARNTIGAFTLPSGLRMAANAEPGCRGATFTVPVRTTGVSGRL
jgi:hypothetical protein